MMSMYVVHDVNILGSNRSSEGGNHCLVSGIEGLSTISLDHCKLRPLAL